MIPTTIIDLADWSGGTLLAGVPTTTIDSLSTDTRSLREGDVFLALKGENFNGHDFLEKAIEAGASNLVVSELPPATECFRGGIVHVRDTGRALREIALNYRRQRLPGLTAVGITGSNGKTTTKDFLAAVLSRLGPVNATKSNLNNHIGLPLTVLRTETDHRFGVWEMGMNHPGEIGPLAEVARQDAAVIPHIGTAKNEHMKTREAIAEEKSMLPRAVSREGFCVMPAGDDFFAYMSGVISCEMVGVGAEDSPIRAERVSLETGRAAFDLWIHGAIAPVVLPVTGRHMIMNALLAAAVGFRQGLSTEAIAEALSGAEMTAGRLQAIDWRGITILDDSYNANPDSMKAALASLSENRVEGRRIAVLGFMGELGESEESGHREVGEFAAECGIDLLVVVSERARPIAEGAAGRIEVRHFGACDEASALLRSELKPGDHLLVKGSRAAGMEKVIQLLTE